MEYSSYWIRKDWVGLEHVDFMFVLFLFRVEYLMRTLFLMEYGLKTISTNPNILVFSGDKGNHLHAISEILYE